MITGPVLARLDLDPDPSRRALYWRGHAEPDPAGNGLVLAAGHRLDLGTWFNAAPLAWWRGLLGSGEFVLDVVAAGELVAHMLDTEGNLESRTSTVNGHHRMTIADDRVTWCWLDLMAPDGPGRLESIRWSAPGWLGGQNTKPGVTAVVPTHGREQQAVAQLRRLLGSELADVVARVVVVDQARTLRSAPGVGRIIEEAGDRLIVCEQENLGGSGGYARGMSESQAFPGDPVLLLDDDARIDPEGLRRMLTLSRLTAAAGRPTILGTPLFSAERPTMLTALAEGVRPRGFRWGPSDGLDGPIDLSAMRPEAWQFARAGARSDYAGWWGALLPAGAIAELGLPAPYFLKWDDAEYGLRARRAGYGVRTIPGTGCWHPTWAAKGTITSWAAWPLHRNRLATAAAYGADRTVLVDSLVHQVKHVLTLQYDTADLWDAALAQVTTGTGWLDSGWQYTRRQAEALLARPPSPPLPARMASRVPSNGSCWTNAPGRAPELARALLGVFRPARTRRVVAVPVADFRWQVGLGQDVVVLEGTDRELRRDPARARKILARTLRLHLAAARHWRPLSSAYAAALPKSRAQGRWRRVIEREGQG